MTRLFRLLVVVGIFGASLPANAEWRQAESAHFILRADLPEPEIRRIASELESFDAVLRAATGANTPKLSTKVQILLFPDVRAGRELTGLDAYQGGVTHGSAFGPLALVSMTYPGQDEYSLRKVLFHEYAHGFMEISMDEIQPLWFVEGFASLFETAQINLSGEARYGRNRSKAAYLGELGLVSLGDLLAADMLIDTSEGPAPAQLYASGWLLARARYFGGTRSTELAAFLKDYSAGVAGGDNAARYFAGGLDGFDKDMLADARGGLADERQLTFTPPSADAIEIRVMRPGETELWRLAARPPVQRATDVTKFEALRKHFNQLEAILAKYPEETAFAPLAAQFGWLVEAYDRVNAIADRLLIEKPGDPDLIAIKGVSLTEIAVAGGEVDFDRMLAKGRALLDQTIKRDPDNVLALIGLYRNTVAAEGATMKAATYLRQAIKLDPSNTFAREALIELYLRNGDGKNALLLLLPVANAVQDSEARILARARVAALKAGKAPEVVTSIHLTRTPR